LVVSASKHVFSMVLVVGAKREEILWEELLVDAGKTSRRGDFFPRRWPLQQMPLVPCSFLP